MLSASNDVELMQQKWPFNGIFGRFDESSLQRGFQVYREVCSACHGIRHVSYRDLKGIGYSNDEIKVIAADYEVIDGPDDNGEMFDREGRPSDKFVGPYENDKVARLANNGAYPPDLSLIVKARAPAVRATSALTRYDHDLIRTVVWRTLSGGDDPITPSDKSLRVEVEAGAADLRLEDVGRIASTGVRLEVIRPHGAFTTFTVACAAATVYDRARKTIASPESTGGDAFEFSVGHGDADLNGIRASLTSLTARHTSVIWRAEAWWAFRDFFRCEYVRDARDGPPHAGERATARQHAGGRAPDPAQQDQGPAGPVERRG